MFRHQTFYKKFQFLCLYSRCLFQSRAPLLLVSLVMTRVTCQESSSFLAALNDANIGLGQVVFLPGNQRPQQGLIDDIQTSVREERNIVFEEDDDEEEYEYSDVTTVTSYNRDEDIVHLTANGDEISSAEDLAVSDPDEAINSVDPLEAVFLEEESLFPAGAGVDDPPPTEPIISGSYAYMRKQSSWSLNIFMSLTSAYKDRSRERQVCVVTREKYSMMIDVALVAAWPMLFTGL